MRGAVAVYDEVLARFGDAEEPGLREQVARALVNKGVTLGQMGDSAAAVAVYDEVLARFGDAQEPGLREEVARALVNKGVTLGRMGDSAAELAVYEEVLARFGDAQEPGLREEVARARISLANISFDFQEEFARAEALYREAALVEPLLANANLAWLLLLANRVTEAIDLRASLGGLPAHGLALLDAAITLAGDNFGSATDHLTAALSGELDQGAMDFSGDIDRLLRLAERKDYGERLIAWFEKTGFADRVAPIYVAFKAYVRGGKALARRQPRSAATGPDDLRSAGRASAAPVESCTEEGAGGEKAQTSAKS